MPTNHTGAKANTQAPSAKPEPEGTITAAIPADGDPPNASTFAQAFKVCADFIDFLLKIQAKASDWAKWIWAARSAGGHKRFIVDHFGLPSGRLVQHREDWARGVDATGTSYVVAGVPAAIDITGKPLIYHQDIISGLAAMGAALQSAGAAAGFISASAAGAGFLDTAGDAAVDLSTKIAALQGHGDWRIRTVQTTGTSEVLFNGPDGATTVARHRFVKLSAGNTAGDLAIIWRKAPADWDESLHLVLEWEAKLSAADTAQTRIAMGFCIEDGTVAETGSDASDFAVFLMAPGGGNWFLKHRSASGTAAGEDTGVVATTNWTRFRLELHGATVADDTTRAIRAYINGTKVADFTTVIPVATVKAAPHFGCVNTGGSSGGAFVAIGPVNLTHNLHGSDVA